MDRASERNEALLQAGLILASELSLPAVLQKIVDLACVVADARYGALGVLTPDGDEIHDFITYGVTEDERRAIGPLPHGHGILGVLINEAQPLRLERIQDHPRSVGFPAHHPPMTSFLGVPVKVRDRVFGNLYLTEKRGAAVFDADDERAVETLATQAAVAIENARLYHAAAVRERRLAAINEVSLAIVEGGDTRDVLRLIAGQARDLVGSDIATIVVPDAERTGLVVTVAVGARAEELDGLRFAREGSLSGQVMQERRAITVPLASADPRVCQPLVEIGGIGPAMFVPLSARDRVFGTLAVANLEGGRGFAREDLDVVRVFAAQAALMLDHARLQEELQRLAVLEDRERIAKELHDGVVQSLFAVGMGLEATGALSGSAEIGRRLANAVDDLDRVIRELRGYIFGLRPGGTLDLSLLRALQDLAEGFATGASASIDVRVDADVASRLSARANDLLQLAREAISNAVRHSGASSIVLTLRRQGRRALMEVRDDGKGFDPTAPSTGQGMSTLRARADALNGLLAIDSDESGTRVQIELPLYAEGGS